MDTFTLKIRKIIELFFIFQTLVFLNIIISFLVKFMSIHELVFFYKNIVIPAQAKYSYLIFLL